MKIVGIFLYLVLITIEANAQISQFFDTGQRLGIINSNVATIGCGDLNNDGFVDLVLASKERDTIIQLYMNDGKGFFTRSNNLFSITENSNPLWNFGITINDFNKDNLLDIATADAWRGVNIYLNTKNNGFVWAQALLVPEVNEVKGIDSADVDSNGTIDLVFGGHNGVPDRGDRIYLNDGRGYFADSGQKIGSDVTWKTIFGDLNNDGNIDYVSVNRYREKTAKIHVNNGTGLFEQIIDIPTTETDDSYDINLADLNKDGLLDIVIANSLDTQKGTTSKIFLNTGDFNFELKNDTLGEANVETKDISIIDLDKDGNSDIVLGNFNNSNTMFINDGAGNFLKSNIEIPSYETTAIEACDVNNDGLVDLIAADNLNDSYKVYLQKKTLTMPFLILLLNDSN